jgi:hypothetical protein
MMYNSCTGIYKFGNNTYPRRIRRRSNLGSHFLGKKSVSCGLGNTVYRNPLQLMLNINVCRWPLCCSLHFCSHDGKDVKHFVIYLEILSEFAVLSHRYWLDVFRTPCSWCNPKGSFLVIAWWDEWASQAHQKHLMAFQIWKPACPLPAGSVLTVVVNTDVWSSAEVQYFNQNFDTNVVCISCKKSVIWITFVICYILLSFKCLCEAPQGTHNIETCKSNISVFVYT